MPRKPRRSRSRAVREPIQVYLNTDERALLDRMAAETGLSRAEILRRGLRGFATREGSEGSPMLRFMKSVDEASLPSDMAARHDDYLAEGYVDSHES